MGGNEQAPMIFIATKKGVFNRGIPPDSFLTKLVDWGRTASEDIFAVNPSLNDIYIKVKQELGPWESALRRRGTMLEVMRVLAGFESSWDWTEGVDTSRMGDDTPENAEAGAWQLSYDSRRTGEELVQLLDTRGIRDGISFQLAMKYDHRLAMEYVARLMRWNTKHNGPLYKGDERVAIRKSLRGAEQSIYPWLSRASTFELMTLLS